MSHVETHYLRYWSKEPASPLGIRVANLLDRWNGLNHFEDTAMKKVEWHNPQVITLRLSIHFGIGQLSTFDFDALTRLVFLAHDDCIRVAIRPCNPQNLTLVFHGRQRTGDISQRHPELEDAVAAWRAKHPAPKFEPATAIPQLSNTEETEAHAA